MKHRNHRHTQAKKVIKGKPAVEKIWRGIPEVEIFDNDPEMPVFIEKHRTNRVSRVENGDILTLRLGMHSRSRPVGIGAFTRECAAICVIPTMAAKEQNINALFAQPDIAPAVFMDSITLYSDTPFRLELVEGSAKLEHNCKGGALPLSNDAIVQEDDTIIISNNLQVKIPRFHTYTFDFISVQVHVVFEG